SSQKRVSSSSSNNHGTSTNQNISKHKHKKNRKDWTDPYRNSDPENRRITRSMSSHVPYSKSDINTEYSHELDSSLSTDTEDLNHQSDTHEMDIQFPPIDYSNTSNNPHTTPNHNNNANNTDEHKNSQQQWRTIPSHKRYNAWISSSLFEIENSKELNT
ncbi:4690_t:CDS:1, partial [Racocetra fulgida]